MKSRVLVTTLVIGLGSIALAFSPLREAFQNLDRIANSVGLQFYSQANSNRTVRLAILDNGFKGLDAEIGRTLPNSTVYHAGPVDVDPATEDSHGLAMAQIVAGLLEKTPGVRYQLDLFSAFGYSNFEDAVKKVIQGQYDIVLYSQVWEYGGNGDGKGFINKLVNRAVSNGTLWINAAGNFAKSTYIAPVTIGASQWVSLPGPNDSIRIRCQSSGASSGGTCRARVVLSWNDFKDDVKLGTDKDLDLVLTDDSLKIVASSGLQQMPSVPEGAPAGASLYSREIIQTEIQPGLFFIRVKARSRNFDPRKDLLRVTVSGEGVELIDALRGETVLPPGDNPNVITVGAFDSDRSSTAPWGHKPEITAPSMLILDDGQQVLGSSNAAAIAAAAAVVARGLDAKSNRETILNWISNGAYDPNRYGFRMMLPRGN